MNRNVFIKTETDGYCLRYSRQIPWYNLFIFKFLSCLFHRISGELKLSIQINLDMPFDIPKFIHKKFHLALQF